MKIPIPFVPKGGIYHDQEDKLRLESRNGVIQAEFVIREAVTWNAKSRVTTDLICELQRLAVNQIYRCAGYFRDGPVVIDGGTGHKPPDHSEVASLAEGMCEYLNTHWEATPVHLSSFAMWRMNWIHPFFGGNGRTARALSYLVLCGRLGYRLPGEKTIPELIVERREHYLEALHAADDARSKGVLDITAMEDLMSGLIADQLLAIHEQATGKTFEGPAAEDPASSP